MSQLDPQYSASYTPATRTSGTAITSLILGIFLCVPLITGLGAVLFGIAGMRATRNPGVRGRGMAVAGLTLGLAGLIGWSGIGAMIAVGWSQTSPDRAITSAFVNDLNAGNLSAAQGRCTPAVTTAQLQQAIDLLKTFGVFSSYSNNSYHINWNTDGTATAVISGAAFYGNGVHSITVTLLHPRQGSPVIQGYNIR